MASKISKGEPVWSWFELYYIEAFHSKIYRSTRVVEAAYISQSHASR